MLREVRRVRESALRQLVEAAKAPAPKRIRVGKKKKAAPNRLRFTDTNVLTLKLKSKDYLVWDHGTDAARGLAVHIQPSGTRTYRATFYYPGNPNALSMKLGRVGEMPLEEARTKTREARRLASQGLDPRAGDPARSGTFGTLLDDYFAQEQVGRKGNRSADQTKSLVEYHCSKWKPLPAATLRYEVIDDLLRDIRDKQKKPPMANRIHAHLNALFRWAVRTRKLPASPMDGMPPPWDGAKPREREWFSGEKADAIVKKLWTYADQVGGSKGIWLKLLILTGKRKTAVATMRWEQIDQSWFWTPPPGSKNKRCTPIPLPKLAQRIIGQRQAEGWVCYVSDGAGTTLATDIRETVETTFLLHGIRHLVETKLGELRVPPHVRDLLLDHAMARSATARGYDHGSYRDEMLEALELWSWYVEKLVAPGAGVAVLR